MIRIARQSKVQLTGSILGVAACHIATDRANIRVGSSLDADLVVADPLIPPLAFTLRRRQARGDGAPSPDAPWIVEASSRARVFVNDRLTARECLAFGDTIASGCHRFVFEPADLYPRNCLSRTTVDDLCAALLKEQTLPPGYLQTCPRHRHSSRLRRALAWAAALGALAALLVFIAPSPPKFEPIQPPLEVTVLADRVELPAPDAVRSLKDVKRQTVAPPAMPKADIYEQTTPAVAVLAAEARAVDAAPAFPPPAPQLAKMTPAIAAPPPPVLKGVEREVGVVKHDPIRLAATAPARRLTLSEAAGTTAVELQPAQIRSAVPAAFNATAVSASTGNGIQAPDHRILERHRAQRLETLAVFKPSPVRFENFGGAQVPVARLSESLAPLESVKPGDYQVDAKVTEGEISKSWKSGRFRVHAPGNPPPEADPATYCYVGRGEAAGKPCLYIAFICAEPKPDQIIANVGRNPPCTDLSIILDDSVEIFLDTDNNRSDYHQMIVNARGAYWSAYFPSSRTAQQFNGRPWDPQATVKSSISREASQWVCEILIPFERLGGVPPKGARWTVNFCRNFRGQKEDWQLQSWFNVYDTSRDYHHPKNFGMFEW